MALGIDVEKFLVAWIQEHIGEYLPEVEPDQISRPTDAFKWVRTGQVLSSERLRGTYSLLLDAFIAAIEENNRVIAGQLSRVGVDLSD